MALKDVFFKQGPSRVIFGESLDYRRSHGRSEKITIIPKAKSPGVLGGLKFILELLPRFFVVSLAPLLSIPKDKDCRAVVRTETNPRTVVYYKTPLPVHGWKVFKARIEQIFVVGEHHIVMEAGTVCH